MCSDLRLSEQFDPLPEQFDHIPIDPSAILPSPTCKFSALPPRIQQLVPLNFKLVVVPVYLSWSLESVVRPTYWLWLLELHNRSRELPDVHKRSLGPLLSCIYHLVMCPSSSMGSVGVWSVSVNTVLSCIWMHN